MRILIIGASQGSGALAAKIALKEGHEVTAFARHPEKLGLENPKLKKVKGDFHDRASVASAVKGHDVVIITASATSFKAFKEHPNYFSEGTQYVIDAMRSAGVRRLVVLSAWGVGDSRKQAPFLLRKLFFDTLLKVPYRDHEIQENQVRKSGLEWVIARPTRLTNHKGKGKYQKKGSTEKVPSSISREDVADFLVQAATSDGWLSQAVSLGG